MKCLPEKDHFIPYLILAISLAVLGVLLAFEQISSIFMGRKVYEDIAN